MLHVYSISHFRIVVFIIPSWLAIENRQRVHWHRPNRIWNTIVTTRKRKTTDSKNNHVIDYRTELFRCRLVSCWSVFHFRRVLATDVLFHNHDRRMPPLIIVAFAWWNESNMLIIGNNNCAFLRNTMNHLTIRIVIGIHNNCMTTVDWTNQWMNQSINQ